MHEVATGGNRDTHAFPHTDIALAPLALTPQVAAAPPARPSALLFPYEYMNQTETELYGGARTHGASRICESWQTRFPSLSLSLPPSPPSLSLSFSLSLSLFPSLRRSVNATCILPDDVMARWSAETETFRNFICKVRFVRSKSPQSLSVRRAAASFARNAPCISLVDFTSRRVSPRVLLPVVHCFLINVNSQLTLP